MVFSPPITPRQAKTKNEHTYGRALHLGGRDNFLSISTTCLATETTHQKRQIDILTCPPSPKCFDDEEMRDRC